MNDVLKLDFPILQQKENEKALVYLDSGATSQKPLFVIQALLDYYQQDNANVHRGLYALSERATLAYEASRQTIKNFINAKSEHEIVFTRGTTEAINLVAYSFGRAFIKAGDEVLITTMEHHSNIVPWQVLCEQVGAELKVVPVLDDGTIAMADFTALLNSRVKLVAMAHVSNALGTINPVKKFIALAHAHNIPVLLDGAQAVPHLPVDVQDLDCDFYAFSSHKMYGPMGVGVLYAKEHWLEKMPPYQTGGDMITRVTFEKTDYNLLPHKFEAGTPNVGGVIGLSAAVSYLSKVGMPWITEHERVLTQYATTALQQVPGLKIIGTALKKVGVISFVMSQAHPHDIGTILDSEGVAIRAGHHCAMPLMDRLGVAATVRVSLGLYNNKEDIDHLIKALNKVIQLFGEA